MNALQKTTADQPDLTVEEWMSKVGAAVRNPPANKEDFRVRCAAVKMACHDLVPRVWCQQSAILGMQKFQFWPSAADVRELLGQFEMDTRPLAAQLGVSSGRAMERIAGPTPIGGCLPEITSAAERAYVRQQADLVKAELGDDAPGIRGAPPAKPSYLNKLQLALAASDAVLATRPDLVQILSDHRLAGD